MRIPFARPWIPDASKKHVAEAMETGRIGRSDYYAAQCREHLQDLVNREFILLVNSGTMALQCALAARPEWDTVRVPDYTFGATANAVLLAGRKLILAEKLPKTHSIHVAMHGTLRDYGGAGELIDGAQAFDVVTEMPDWADITGSFFVNKCVTSGEGGYYATNDPDRYILAKGYMDHGRVADGFGQTIFGASGHMPDLNAALLLGQLENWSERHEDWKRQHEAWRDCHGWARFAGWCVTSESQSEGIQTARIRKMRRAGIDVRRDFWPLRALRAFRDTPTEGDVVPSHKILLPAWHGIPDEAIDEMKDLCKSTSPRS